VSSGFYQDGDHVHQGLPAADTGTWGERFVTAPNQRHGRNYSSTLFQVKFVSPRLIAKVDEADGVAGIIHISEASSKRFGCRGFVHEPDSPPWHLLTLVGATHSPVLYDSTALHAFGAAHPVSLSRHQTKHERNGSRSAISSTALPAPFESLAHHRQRDPLGTVRKFGTTEAWCVFLRC
jgi:hypothetical protein